MKRSLALILGLLFTCQIAYASPWASKESYGGKTAGKFLFGLKNSLLGWTEIFTEPEDHKYDLKKTGWEGLCNGISKTAFYTAGGLIQLATFPVPVDFPNMGDCALPNLGKKTGAPKPWEVHGKSRYSMVPADQVPVTVKAAPSETLEEVKPMVAAPVPPVPAVQPVPEPVVTVSSAPVPASPAPVATPAASEPVTEPAAVPAPVQATAEDLAADQPNTASAVPSTPDSETVSSVIK